MAAPTAAAGYGQPQGTGWSPAGSANRRGLVVRVAVLVISALAAGALFLPWASDNFGFGTYSVSGYDFAKADPWKIWNPTNPWIVFILLCVSALVAIVFIANARSKALAAIPLVATGFVFAVFIDYVSQTTPPGFSWGFGLWATGVLSLIDAILAIVVLASPIPTT